MQQSDHSGDPVVTLLGALVDAMPSDDRDKYKEAYNSAKKIGGLCVRAGVKAVFKSGAGELIDAVTDTAIDKLDDFDALDKVINELGHGMSKAAGQFIAAQMAAEKVRREELPRQLETLHAALLQDSKSNRVIIVIDELDRCHPDYAIAVLEAMKLVFNQSGFVFCLMVNADYLENLAQHRFGTSNNDEKYLDKFVDIRLGLGPRQDNFKNAVFELALELPHTLPYGDSESFSLNHAAELASTLAVLSELSMRKVKRILLKVEIALRCYADRPLDTSLLVFLAFREEVGGRISDETLPRSTFTPDEGEKYMEQLRQEQLKHGGASGRAVRNMQKKIAANGSELLELPYERYKYPETGRSYHDWAMVFQFLAPHYLPSHRDVLNAVASVIAPAD